MPNGWVDFPNDRAAQQSRYATAVGAAWAFIKACARAHAPWHEVRAHIRSSILYHDAYMTKTTRHGRRRQLSESDAEARCLKDWNRAVQQVEDHPEITSQVGAIHSLAQIRDSARHYPWTGRTAIRDKIVLGALLDAGTRLHSVNPTVSVRTLCESTPYRDHKSIRTALKALTALGWIHPDRSDAAKDQPTTYRISVPAFPRVGHQSPGHGASRGEPRLGTDAPPVVPIAPSAGRDAMRLALVTSTRGQAVYAALWERPQGRNQIAKRAGVSPRTVSRWLLELATLGLAVKDPDGWVIGASDPVDTAFKWDANAIERDRRDKHVEEREDWQGRKARRAKSDAEVNERISALAAARRERNVHKCVATTRRGDPCPVGADEWGLCHVHDPEGVYATQHRSHRDRMLAQPAVMDALATRPAAASVTVVPVASGGRGPETRASAVNPDAWAALGGAQ